jgi:hypothetical protein
MSDTIISRVKSHSTSSRLPYRFAGIVLLPSRAGMTCKKLEIAVHDLAGSRRVRDTGAGTEFFKFPNDDIDGFLRITLPASGLPVVLLQGETADELKSMFR